MPYLFPTFLLAEPLKETKTGGKKKYQEKTVEPRTANRRRERKKEKEGIGKGKMEKEARRVRMY